MKLRSNLHKMFSNNPDDDETITVREAADLVSDLAHHYKKGYQASSKKDKAKILLIVLPLLITFILGFVGIVIANVGQFLQNRQVEIIGFVFMGVGLGGFFLIILGLGIYTSIKDHRGY